MGAYIVRTAHTYVLWNVISVPTQYCITPYHTIPHHTPYRTIPHHTPYRTIPFKTLHTTTVRNTSRHHNILILSMSSHCDNT